ncbi:MAG: hypothetical protein WAT66_15865 [Actinomycetota bacterium]
MGSRRTSALLASAVVVLSYLLVPIGPAAANHGPGAANCPTDMEIALVVLLPSGEPVFAEEGTSAPPITYGDRILVGGELSANQTTDPGADVSDEAVDVKATDVGTSLVHTYPATTGNGEDAGIFAIGLDPPLVPFASARWIGTWTGAASTPCDGVTETSDNSIFLGVRARVAIHRSNVNPDAGEAFRITGGVAPNHAGKLVTLQWRREGGDTLFSTVLTLDSSSRYSKRFVSRTPGARWLFRTLYPRQDAEHLANRTRWVRVTIG